VEFQNNQIGKPKVTFEGNSEEYKENDAVLFFDGRTLRLERLDRAVKQLRHLRMPGESSAAAAGTVTAPAAPSGPALDPRSSPIGKPIKSAPFSSGRSSNQAVPVRAYQLSYAVETILYLINFVVYEDFQCFYGSQYLTELGMPTVCVNIMRYQVMAF
jgi:ELL-associated factor